MNGFDQIRTRAKVDQACEAEHTADSAHEAERTADLSHEAERTAGAEEIRAIHSSAVQDFVKTMALQADFAEAGVVDVLALVDKLIVGLRLLTCWFD